VLEGTTVRPLDLKSGTSVTLPPGAREYQYAIINQGPQPAAMPILFSSIRWDSFDALIETAGLRKIEDELDRAIAIWRFVAEHRVHGHPVTEGDEEHDLVKFLACYGYGFCDDSAQAVVVLAKACGLQARIRGLGGHVVPEILAGGKWRMLDPDFAVHFHEAGDPRAIHSADELTDDRQRFEHARGLGSGGPYNKAYADLFLSTSDNVDWPIRGAASHRVEHIMAPGERVVFSSFNWGRYFLGAYPDRPPRFYNGYFERLARAADFHAGDGLQVTAAGEAFIVRNRSPERRAVAVEFTSPFPIVGGEFSGVPNGLQLEWEEGTRHVPLESSEGAASFDAAVAQLSPHPTYRFKLNLFVPPGAEVSFAAPPRIIIDFQFAETVLLPLGAEPRPFTVDGEHLEQFRAELRVK
jgi:hypothetical protein